jgi:hypothetical protein
MASREDNTQKQPEVMLTSATVVPDLGKQANIVTTKEKISAYFTLAAAASGLLTMDVSHGLTTRVVQYRGVLRADDAQMLKIRTIS